MKKAGMQWKGLTCNEKWSMKIPATMKSGQWKGLMLWLLIVTGSCKPKFNHWFDFVHSAISSLLDTLVLRQVLLWITAFLLPACYALNNNTVGLCDALCLKDCGIKIWYLIICWQCPVLSLQCLKTYLFELKWDSKSKDSTVWGWS